MVWQCLKGFGMQPCAGKGREWAARSRKPSCHVAWSSALGAHWGPLQQQIVVGAGLAMARLCAWPGAGASGGQGAWVTGMLVGGTFAVKLAGGGRWPCDRTQAMFTGAQAGRGHVCLFV